MFHIVWASSAATLRRGREDKWCVLNSMVSVAAARHSPTSADARLGKFGLLGRYVQSV